MQREEAFENAQAAAAEKEGGGLLDALLFTAPDLLGRYQNQLVAIRDTLRFELRLNLKCAVLVLFFSIMLACVLLSSWVGFNALLFFGLDLLNTPRWVSISALAIIHLVALFALYRTIKLVFSEMGFGQLQSVLGMTPSSSQESES